MAITSLTGVQTAVKQSFPVTASGNSATVGAPRIVLFSGNMRIPAPLNVNNPSNASGIQFTNPAPGRDTYISNVEFVNLGLPPGYFLILDVVFGYTLSNVTTLQTLTPQSIGARDINGSTRGDGIYLMMAVSGTNLSGTNTVLTATYTSSEGNINRTASATIVTLNGNQTAFLNIQNGDTGVQSVQSVRYSVLPGGPTYLLGYRPIALVVLSNDLRTGATGDAISLGLPRVYDNSCIQILYGAAGGAPTGTISFIQG